MIEYRYVVVRMRLGDSNRALSKAGLIGRPKAKALRAVAESQGWLYPETPLPNAILELARAGMGVSILSRWALEPDVIAGTLACTRVTRQGLDIDWFAVVRKSDTARPPAHRLARTLTTWCGTPQVGFHTVGSRDWASISKGCK